MDSLSWSTSPQLTATESIFKSARSRRPQTPPQSIQTPLTLQGPPGKGLGDAAASQEYPSATVINSWNEEEVCAWLLKNAFKQATLSKFRKYNIDGTDLLDLDDDDLIALEVSPAERQRLLKIISRLNPPRSSRFTKRPQSRSSRLSLAAWASKGADNARVSRISEQDNIADNGTATPRASRNVSAQDAKDQPVRDSLDSFYDSLFKSPNPDGADEVPEMQSGPGPAKAKITGALATASDTNLLKPSSNQHTLRNPAYNRSDTNLVRPRTPGLADDRRRHGYCCPDPPPLLHPEEEESEEEKGGAEDEDKENDSNLLPNAPRLSKALKKTKSMLIPQSGPPSPSRESSQSTKFRGNKVVESSKQGLRQAKTNLLDARKLRTSPVRGRRMSATSPTTTPPPPSRGKSLMRSIYSSSSGGKSSILDSMKRFSFTSRAPSRPASRPETADSSNTRAKRFSIFSNHRLSRAVALFKAKNTMRSDRQDQEDCASDRPKSHAGNKSRNSLLSQTDKLPLRRGHSDLSHPTSKAHNQQGRISLVRHEPPRPKTAVPHGKRKQHTNLSSRPPPDREASRNYAGVMRMRRTDNKRGDHWEQYFFSLENNRLMTYRDEHSRNRNDDPLVTIGVRGYAVSPKDQKIRTRNPTRNNDDDNDDDDGDGDWQNDGFRFVLAPKGDGIMTFEFCVRTAQERFAWIRRFAMASSDR